jgi:gamma-glutamylputrescine oxidase
MTRRPPASSEHAPSCYAHSAHPSPPRPPLQGSVQADVCIVGGGYTGLSAGIALAEAGLQVVLLEQARIGWGASGRNGGQIVHSYSRDIDVIQARHGAAVAKPLARMMFEGAAVIRERVARYAIDCDLKDGGAYAAINANKAQELLDQQRLWERWGHPGLQFLDTPADVHRHVGSDRYSAVLFDPTGGHFHPLNLALGEAAALESLGGRIHEDCAVLRIERGEPAVVHTAQGQVRARFVIVACNAYIGQLEPVLASRSMPCGTQVIATAPLGEMADRLIPSDCCVEDNNFLLDYFRLSADKRLVYGGGVIYGARDPARVEALVRPKMLRTFPELANVAVEFGWTGNFLLTLSRLPQVGRLTDNVYYSQGCSGHGVTFTHLIGRVLGEAIRGQADRFDAFARLPHHPFPGGRLLRVPLTALGALWYELRDRLGI